MNTISRRTFISAAAGGAALAMLPRSPFAVAAPLGLPIGVQLYTVGAELQKDLDGTLQKLAAIGYRSVETAGFSSGKITVAQMRAALDKAGLRCQSAHYGLPQLQGGVQKVIDDTQALGASYVVCPTPWVADMSRFAAAMKGNKPEAAFGVLMNNLTMDDWRWNAEQLNKAGEALKKAGLQLAYHNHGFEFKIVDGNVVFDELLKMTEPDLVAIEMDCGWVANTGYDPAGYITRFPDRVHLLHIKDINQRPVDRLGLEMAGIHTGGGVLDWPGIFAAAKRAGVKGYFVEQEPPFPAPVFDELKASYDYLNQLS